jgi:hypothetical protein
MRLLNILITQYINYSIMELPEIEGVNLVRLNAEVDEERRRRLYHVLLDDGLSFTEWLRRQIDSYLAAKEPKGKKKPKGRG